MSSGGGGSAHVAEFTSGATKVVTKYECSQVTEIWALIGFIAVCAIVIAVIVFGIGAIVDWKRGVESELEDLKERSDTGE